MYVDELTKPNGYEYVQQQNMDILMRIWILNKVLCTVSNEPITAYDYHNLTKVYINRSGSGQVPYMY